MKRRSQNGIDNKEKNRVKPASMYVHCVLNNDVRHQVDRWYPEHQSTVPPPKHSHEGISDRVGHVCDDVAVIQCANASVRVPFEGWVPLSKMILVFARDVLQQIPGESEHRSQSSLPHFIAVACTTPSKCNNPVRPIKRRT